MTERSELTARGYRRFRCRDCGRQFNERSGGALTRTSLPSEVELVQKAARAGIATMAAISVPTALAIRTAEAAGITLVAVARGDGFEVFTDGGGSHRRSLPPSSSF